MQRLWVTGYRNYEINAFTETDPKITIIKYALKQFYLDKLENQGLDWVITGANLGVEQWAAQVALDLQKTYPLRVSIIVPYTKFSERWNDKNQLRFAALKAKVDFFAATSNQPYQNPIQLRLYQNFMLQHTDQSLMIYDPEHPEKPKFDFESVQKYQKTHTYPLRLIDFYDLQDVAEGYVENHHQDRFSE